MHLLVVSYKDGTKDYFGPFPTFFRANEYSSAILKDLKGLPGLREISHCTVVPMILPHTMRVRFK